MPGRIVGGKTGKEGKRYLCFRAFGGYDGFQTTCAAGVILVCDADFKKGEVFLADFDQSRARTFRGSPKNELLIRKVTFFKSIIVGA